MNKKDGKNKVRELDRIFPQQPVPQSILSNLDLSITDEELDTKLQMQNERAYKHRNELMKDGKSWTHSKPPSSLFNK